MSKIQQKIIKLENIEKKSTKRLVQSTIETTRVNKDQVSVKVINNINPNPSVKSVNGAV